MSHLSRDELLAAAEGPTGPPEHLAGCASCRAEVEALASVVRDARSLRVPEPSPLFWEHFSEHVREACAREASGLRESAKTTRDSWEEYARRRWRSLLAAVVVIVLLAGGASLLVRDSTAPGPPPNPTTAAAGGVSAPVDQPPASDDSWASFTAVASEADPAGTAFGAPAPGVADGAVPQMTDDERGELIRLLKDELARRGARSEG